MDKSEFLERLANAIDKRIPQDANRKSWLRRRALDSNLSYETLAGYVYGENEPGVLNWVKLNLIFPGLHAEVFEDEPDEDPIDLLERAITRLRNQPKLERVK